ncbi:hypothetical protein POTOM_001779 [Populus tomentosa]|uniref:HTH myb-type domain-containing protein n=1 Tax=Populus tomentosa TaxID=118781 RepID=A0A8X8IW40_POPTO|nr:hypothetical protein POTOM_001779 [Populus tomentosa]
MNTQKRKVLEQNCSLETFTSKQMPSDGSMGFRFQFNLPALHEGSIPRFSPGTSSTPSAPIISSHFASSASAPYAPEGCEGLSCDTASSLSTCSPVGKTQCSVVNPQNSILDLKSSVAYQPFTSQVTRPTSPFQPQKQPAYSPYDMTSGANDSVSLGATIKSKIRVRWTRDLHKRFVESVNRLGGAEKATPKGILKEMDVHGLTIFHVKSHLQQDTFRNRKKVYSLESSSL